MIGSSLCFLVHFGIYPRIQLIFNVRESRGSIHLRLHIRAPSRLHSTACALRMLTNTTRTKNKKPGHPGRLLKALPLFPICLLSDLKPLDQHVVTRTVHELWAGQVSNGEQAAIVPQSIF